MTREEIYTQCVQRISKTNCLFIEAATGTGKTKVSINLANYLINSKWYKDSKQLNILILVAKRVHKKTWKDEISKWGGIHHPTADINICMECYESLKNHCNEKWDIILADEVHHIGSDIRLDFLKTMTFGYFLGLSATIPRKLKQFFKYRYHVDIVTCDIAEAIEDEILPEPQIILFPLMLDNRKPTEEWEMNAKLGGVPVRGEYKELWKFKKLKAHAILSCTQRQKCNEYDKLIEYFKNHNMEKAWLYFAGKRLEYLANCKNPIISDILRKLKGCRTITFCKTIEQAEILGRNCIHSKNALSASLYEAFNNKKIDHITAVNILNENANLVDCQYGIFANISSSEVIIPQRIGRLLRHKSPVLIIPYFEGTREEEIIRDKMLVNFDLSMVKTIHSINEI